MHVAFALLCQHVLQELLLLLSNWAELESLDAVKDITPETEALLSRLKRLGFRLKGTNNLCFPVRSSCGQKNHTNPPYTAPGEAFRSYWG